MISWKFYVNRRRIDQKQWFKSRNISTYQQLVRSLKALGVSPPDEKSVESLFVSVKTKTEPSKKEKAVKQPGTSPKKRSPRAAKKAKVVTKS
tara:strand:- start:216 stop:491 length:276 start_codon:yes stop_codon:yes gene_type:complete